MFGDNEIIFQDDNASCHRAKTVNLNPIENLWWKLKKMSTRRLRPAKLIWQLLSKRVGTKLMQNTVCHSSSPCPETESRL
uniref:Tc1-like transposase DDE domain-containing protein n=1 Tax=Astyanax mexicanus TaxID=7994 RepID=A0A3B1IW61_ASTMX